MKIIQLLLVSFLLYYGMGCASTPYKKAVFSQPERFYQMPVNEMQIERGRPNGFLDVCGWIVGIPSKILLLNFKMDNHFISDNTEQALQNFLDYNEMENVKVRINQYRPGAEWKRLFKGKHTNPVYRYTLGVISVAMYTIMPGRLFGGDSYNPYTNTINIYSDVPAVTIHEGGHAKDFAQRKYKGTYAALYMIPFVPLYHEAQASNEALSYLFATEGLTDEKQAYNILYPAYGTYLGGSVANFLAYPYNYIAYAAGVIPGHIIGRIRGATHNENDLTGFESIKTSAH